MGPFVDAPADASPRTAAPTRITQQIVVDGAELACVVYELVRPASGPAAAQLADVQQERTAAIRAPANFTWGPAPAEHAHAHPAAAVRAQHDHLALFANYPTATVHMSVPDAASPYGYHHSALFS